jgi:phosphoglycerate kinase
MNIQNWNNLVDKKVLVRIDGNVPIEKNIIQNDFRLQAVLPTLQWLREKGAEITLIAHLGRPKSWDPQFSIKPLQQWFDVQNSKVTILENLRFDPRERQGDLAYAKELAQGFDYFVQDAWGALHRHDTSITLLPTCFTPERRSIGLLVQKELTSLNPLKDSPEKPYFIILGGGKGETKLKIIETLIANKKPTTLIVLPALCFTFFKAMGKPVGKSLIDEEFLPKAKRLLVQAENNNITILFPLDVTYLKDTMQGDLKTCNVENFPDSGVGMGVGPRSLEFFSETLKAAKTIFFNGAMGLHERPETIESTQQLLRIIVQKYDAYRVVGGGDSVAIVEAMGLLNPFDFCSTGGGATLAYIAGEQLPGLKVFENSTI